MSEKTLEANVLLSTTNGYLCLKAKDEKYTKISESDIYKLVLEKDLYDVREIGEGVELIITTQNMMDLYERLGNIEGIENFKFVQYIAGDKPTNLEPDTINIARIIEDGNVDETLEKSLLKFASYIEDQKNLEYIKLDEL